MFYCSDEIAPILLNSTFIHCEEIKMNAIQMICMIASPMNLSAILCVRPWELWKFWLFSLFHRFDIVCLPDASFRIKLYLDNFSCTFQPPFFPMRSWQNSPKQEQSDNQTRFLFCVSSSLSCGDS